jgi:hypothetical protein
VHLQNQLDDPRAKNHGLTDGLDQEGVLFNAFLDRKGIDTLLYVGGSSGSMCLE